jgi:hypothetical protein
LLILSDCAVCFCSLELKKRTVKKECMTSLGMLPTTSV